MINSRTKPPPSVQTWTMEDVHRWLVTEVKVHETCANRFREEEVSGDVLVVFKKTDILDLGLKHGPAVKILSHLENLKEGSQHKPQFPAFVENWTKEQVNQWLLQYVNLNSKYAVRIQDEDVSGDCLVHFRKQDLLDLEVKSGPATKILSELSELNKNPEPTLRPVLQTSTDPREAPKPIRPELSPAQDAPTKPAGSNTVNTVQNESANVLQPIKAASGKEIQRSKSQKSEITDPPKITLEIHKTLENLSKEDLKKFQFYLKDYRSSMKDPVPQGNLEDKDTMDTAELMTNHYGSNEALKVTTDLLNKMDQRELLCELEKKMGQGEKPRLSAAALKKEGNHGDKLKTLLTCGGNSLDHYDRLVVVVNKSSPEQVQYLRFLSKLKLFCVLDFDPNSNKAGGLCHSYSSERMANLHTPSQYRGQADLVVKDLKLYKQASWVFCNGRQDLDSPSNELDHRNWLRESGKDVEHLVSFICDPEVLLHGRSLNIFLLLSPVDTEKDPIFDTYKSFRKHTEEQNIITICESQSTYLKWKELLQEKCKNYAIDSLSVYELTLSEINGTVMELGRFSQSPGRLLPSSGSSAVVLKQKDEDFMAALDILCQNQCENIRDEDSPEFHDFRIRVEEEFYRGGKVKWWNFYFCDKDEEKPFVKRDKYEEVMKMIRFQSSQTKTKCVLINLFHSPGCGGTTLAMHVMWDLRQECRCAVLKDEALPKAEVAVQVRHLMKLGGKKRSPVLLLVDDSKGTREDLVNFIGEAVEDDSRTNCKVIILNCVRSLKPVDEYRKHNMTQSQYITASLSEEEQKKFEKKLKELQETHTKPENFYSFMIVKKNFDQKYINHLAHNILEPFDQGSKTDQLFCILALLNTYVAESEVSFTQCEDFLEMKDKRWNTDGVMDLMKPYSNLLIKVEERGGYRGIRILRRSIASACLEEMERSFRLKVSDIAMEMLSCDLFFRDGVLQHRFNRSVQRMLTERQLKGGNERELFSPLIHKIHSQRGRRAVQEVFEKASSRFVTSAPVPQALARYLSIKERDFPEALKWAEKATNIKETPFTLDTIGQINKSYLKSNMDRKDAETSRSPEDLKTNIKMACDAVTAFKRAQDLEKPVEEAAAAAAAESDFPRKSYNIYSHVVLLEMIFLVFEMLSRLPFFDEADPVKKKFLQDFLENRIPVKRMYKKLEETNNESYVEIIKEHKCFLLGLKSEAKQTFELLESYFTYTFESDLKNRCAVKRLFEKYATLFCTMPEEPKRGPQNNPVEHLRSFLEKNQADTFAGLLQHLDSPAELLERITECYEFLQQQEVSNQKQHMKETVNYVLSNIVLHLSNPRSHRVKSHRNLSHLLLKALEEAGLSYPVPDPYYVALLLFWPSPTKKNRDIRAYVSAIRESSPMDLKMFFQKRTTVVHFFLGKGEELQRIVPKSQLDDHFREMPAPDVARLWRNGKIFKKEAIIQRLHRVSGTIKQGEVFAQYGNLKIPVHPALSDGEITGVRTKKVSFYLGFAINGPHAYDIQCENFPPPLQGPV